MQGLRPAVAGLRRTAPCPVRRRSTGNRLGGLVESFVVAFQLPPQESVWSALRDGRTVIHGQETFAQLASIEGSSDRAPEGQFDDRATAFVLALTGRMKLLRMYPAITEMEMPCLLTPGRPPDPFDAIFGPDYGAPRGRTGALGYGAEGSGWW